MEITEIIEANDGQRYYGYEAGRAYLGVPKQTYVRLVRDLARKRFPALAPRRVFFAQADLDAARITPLHVRRRGSPVRSR